MKSTKKNTPAPLGDSKTVFHEECPHKRMRVPAKGSALRSRNQYRTTTQRKRSPISRQAMKKPPTIEESSEREERAGS